MHKQKKVYILRPSVISKYQFIFTMFNDEIEAKILNRNIYKIKSNKKNIYYKGFSDVYPSYFQISSYSLKRTKSQNLKKINKS